MTVIKNSLLKGFLLMAVIMVSLFCISCSYPVKRENTDTDSKDSQDLITVGFSQIGAESDWRLACTDSVLGAFATEKGYNLIYDDGEQKQENQLKAIREFIDMDVDFIILDPITETGWDSALMEAKEAGIPVIIMDRQISVSDTSLYAAWVGADFRKEGDRAVAWLEKVLRYKKGSVNFVEITGTTGATAQIGRSAALAAGIARNDGWNLLESSDGDFVQAKAREIMEDFIRRYGRKINVVYCGNDNEAYGALQALNAAGYRTGTDIGSGEVLVVSFDATRQGLKYTMQGLISMDMECNPLLGPELLKLVKNIHEGKPVDKITYMHEDQFVHLGEYSEIICNGQVYTLKPVTEKLIDGRKY